MSVGVSTIDEDHRHLLDVMNRLYFMALAGDDRTAIGRTIDDVVGDYRDHFRREETLMRQVNYPHRAKHQDAHRAFAERLAGFQAAFRADPEGFSVDAFYDALADWLVVHMTEEDVRLKPYVKASAERSAA